MNESDFSEIISGIWQPQPSCEYLNATHQTNPSGEIFFLKPLRAVSAFMELEISHSAFGCFISVHDDATRKKGLVRIFYV